MRAAAWRSKSETLRAQQCAEQSEAQEQHTPLQATTRLRRMMLELRDATNTAATKHTRQRRRQRQRQSPSET